MSADPVGYAGCSSVANRKPTRSKL